MNMTDEKTISTVVHNGLCTSCGACFAACPAGAITYRETPGGHLFPQIDDRRCTLCGRCRSICPGENLCETAARRLPRDPFTAPLLGCSVGRAQNDVLYANAQSGGIVTALLNHLLNSGAVDGALVATMKRGHPLSGEAMIARSLPELLDAQKSKYIPIPLLKEIPRILQTEGRYAFVGLPCHMHGLYNLFSLYPALERKIAVKIGLICDRVLSLAVLDYFARRASYPSLSYLVFRDKRRPCYPGNVMIESEDGRITVLDSAERIALKDFFTPARCRICFDKLNVLADIVVGDPHGIDGVNRTEGESLALLRTETGKNLYREACEHGVVTARDIQAQDAVTGQGIDNKRQEWNAFATIWKQTARPLPNFADRIFPASLRPSKQTERQCRKLFALSVALDRHTERSALVDAAVSWLRHKKYTDYATLPYRIVRRAAGRAIRKIRSFLRR